VTSVVVLSHFESPDSNSPFLLMSMVAMVGAVAVGLRGGGLLIIDLALDDLSLDDLEDSPRGFPSFSLHSVQPQEGHIVPIRRATIAEKRLICLEFIGVFPIKLLLHSWKPIVSRIAQFY
jgi:hypothetical protein